MAHPAPLRDFLARVRRAGAIRILAATLGNLVLGLAGILLVSIAAVVATQRGDLGQLSALIAVAALCLTLAVSAVRSWLLAYGSAVLAARTIARARRTTPAGLASEVLAAAELADPQSLTEQQSANLAAHYVTAVSGRCSELSPGTVLPPVRVAAFASALLVLGTAAGVLALTPAGRASAELLRLGLDGRPPQPPVPVWSSLEATLHYPPHTGRVVRKIPNPSGPLRAPLGTRIDLSARLTQPADAARLVVTYDSAELVEAPPPNVIELKDQGNRIWSGSFELAASGSWTMVLLEDPNDSVATATLASAPAKLDVEADAPPELELLPLPADQREPSEIESVDLRFRARDDFGLAGATLVYELPDGTTKRLPAGEGAGRRSWHHRYTWDLASVPIERRSEITYWIEVRDNDPGLGLVPLADPPGKPVRSARHKLLVRDEETEHAKNVETLRGIRDQAVDLLGLRLVASPFTENASNVDIARRTALLGEARGVYMLAQRFLTTVSDTVDALSIDRMVPQRDVRVLVEVHRRLYVLHRKESAIHEDFPPGNELRRPQDLSWILARISRHSATQVPQLEDDIIRLDDLVDGQIIADLERLLARLQASQQKLLELLEKLAAGDESVRPQIEQLEQRIREDLRRLSAARAQLRKEVGDEYMNLDAFKAMEERVAHQNVMGSLERGDTEDALRAARETLDEISSLRDAVAQRAGSGEETRLSPEEEARMLLLRELSRLKDDQGQISRETSILEKAWRDAVKQREPVAETKVDDAAKTLLEDLEKINDARLSRDGRRGYEDARDRLEELKREASGTTPDAMRMYDAARETRRSMEQARAGAANGEREARALEKLRRRAIALQDRLLRKLPSPPDSLSDADRSRSGEAGRTQHSLRERLSALAEGPQARDIMPPQGHQALRSARRSMDTSSGALEAIDPMSAGETSREAAKAIQRAIDSLRQGGPPPPSSNRADEASTEAERDRSLRDALMEAMRENPPDGFDEPIERYYEELLQ